MGAAPPPPGTFSDLIYIKFARSFSVSNKLMNRLQRSKNGNGGGGGLKLAHWNAGARHWQRKILELELLVQETDPDLVFISEANLYNTVPDWRRQIQGYKLICPGSLATAGYARLILLVKDAIDCQLLNKFMEDDLATIWVRVGRKSSKPLHIGGVYRQHKLPNQGDMSREVLLMNQRERWSRIVYNWDKAAKNAR